MIPAQSILKLILLVALLMFGCALFSCKKPVTPPAENTGGWQMIGVVGIQHQ